MVPKLGFSGPAAAPLQLAAALLVARGEADFRPDSVDADPECGALAAASSRSGSVGDGCVILGSSFSIDGVHAALSMRVEA